MATILIHPIPDVTCTACPYCGVGCGVLATPQTDGSVSIQGGPTHPANAGRLCVKGSALGETVSLEGRFLYPAIRQRSHDLNAPIAPLQRVTWDTVLDTVIQGFHHIIGEYGPSAVALYVSGQLLTEDYYVANKLMKGFIGTTNIGTSSRLYMSSTVASHKHAFSEDLVPICYDDLEATDLTVLVGLSTAWCHPILSQRIVRAKEARPEMKMVIVDPCHTATYELADPHLLIKPGTDARLFSDLLSFLSRHGMVGRNFITLCTSDPDAALKAAGTGNDDVEAVAKACKLKLDDLPTSYSWFADTERTITVFSMGANQSVADMDKANGIINCHLPTGHIGHAGIGPFSITGQPNTMNGREAGGLASMLAAHMELNGPPHRDLM